MIFCVSKLFALCGAPRLIYSDNGPCFFLMNYKIDFHNETLIQANQGFTI